jgi:Tfp pilus assembly protein PilF
MGRKRRAQQVKTLDLAMQVGGPTHKHLKASPHVLAPALLIAVTAITFLPTLFNDFTNWDDNINLTENPLLIPPTWWGLWQFWKAPFENLYVPLFYTSYFVDLLLGGGVPRASITHAINVLLHCTSVGLAFWLICYLLDKLADSTNLRAHTGVSLVVACALGASVFALHPLQVEAVAWATGRKDLLAGFFTLWAFARYLRFTELRSSAAVSRRAAVLHECAGLALFLLALLAKPSVVVLPVVLALLEFWRRAGWREIARRTAPWFVLALAWTLLTSRTQELTPEARAQLTPLWTRPFIAADAIMFYLKKLVCPVDLVAVYGRTPLVAINEPSVWFALPPLVIATGVALWRRGVVGFAFLMFEVFLLPNSGLVPFVYQRHSTVADRYAYLSLLGAGLGVAAILAHVFAQPSPARRKFAMAVALGLSAIAAFLSFRQTLVWRTSQTLWEHAVKSVPDVALSRANLAAVYMKQDRREEAIQECRRAIELDPRQERAHSNLGVLLLWKGETTAALAHLRRAIEIRPTYGQPHAHLGDYYARSGKIQDAMREYQEAIRLDPKATQAYIGLAYCYFRLGRLKESEETLLQAIATRPHHASVWVIYGNFLADVGRKREAAAAFQHALTLDPSNREAREKLNALRETSNGGDPGGR